MENTMRRPAAAVEDDNDFFVVPNHFTDSDSDIEVIEIESTSDEYGLPIQYKPSVFFEGLLDTYPIDSRIIAKLKFNDGFKKSSGDKVLLLPSGWRSLTEAVSTGLVKNNHVIFESQNLPKKLNEFYQLCYSSTNQTVPGVSDAFSFQDITDQERMVSQVGPSSSRVSYIMDSLWTSLVVESDGIPASEVHLPSDLMVSEESTEKKELGSSEESREKKELESGLQVQEVTVLMEKQELNDTIPNEGNSELSTMKKLVEKMEECDLLKTQVTKLENELNMTQNFVEYMIAHKDERFERLSMEERNAHKSVYNMMKSHVEHPKLDYYMELEKTEYQMSYESELCALKRLYEEKMKASKQAQLKEIDELKQSHQKEMEELQQAHKQVIECLKHSFDEKSQGYASQLVFATYQHDILEKNLKEMKEDYDARLKCCAKEYIKLKKVNEKTTNMNPNSNTSNSYLTDLRDRVRSIKRRSKKEDSK